ncbi:MAG: type II toxin-antitoxin system HicA family toxin [Candidatus Latescibacterota bacterium]
MPRHDATLQQIRGLNGGLQWTRVEALLRHLGAEVYEGTGSTVTFVLGERKLTVDRPHPRKECGKGLVTRVRSYLEATGRV